MPEPGKSDRWNSLLETLGVPVHEPPPAAVSPAEQSPALPPSPAPTKPQSLSMLPPEKPKPVPKPKPAPAPAKSPSYWSRIAGALGLEVPPEPQPPPEEPKNRRIEEPKERQPRPERPPRGVEPPPRAFEPPPAAETPARSPLDEMFSPQPSDVDVFKGTGGDEAPRVREPSAPRSREDDESGSVLEYDVSGGSDLSLREAAARQRGSRGEEGPEREGRRRRRRRGRGRRGRGEGRQEPAPRREKEIEPAGQEVDLEFEREDNLPLDVETSEESDIRVELPERDQGLERGERSVLDEEQDLFPPGQEREQREEREGGHRRHRRRPRGSRERDEVTERPAVFEPDEHDEDRYEERPPAVPRAARRDEEPDEQEGLGEHEEGDEEHAAGLPTHKKIPTWEEAVGALIDANMANRAANPEREHRRGRGRGRGR